MADEQQQNPLGEDVGTDDLPWYTLRTFSNHEKKVKRYLENEIERLGIENQFHEILIPQETVYEMRGGKKKTKEKTLYPGYIFLNAELDTELVHTIKGLPSVIGFLGEAGDPEPLRRQEVERMLGHADEAMEAGEQQEIPFQVGDPIKVVDGPFSDFNGMVEEVYPDKMKVKVLVSIFGRETPLELDYLQVEHDEG
ncbi:MAG: transcription termination/antitermination factor NusG [Bacteroidetes bacterium QS_1_65_9]|jgi:transcriptional antiterminator NusG|nr:MAG: transcription termination/antitermination factor NusG [Bacteroidetes bacterium QS_1_65_9]